MKKTNFFELDEDLEVSLFNGLVSHPKGIYEQDIHHFAAAESTKDDESNELEDELKESDEFLGEIELSETAVNYLPPNKF